MPFDPNKYLITVQANRPYLPVAARLIWFREEHADWGIQTEIVALDPQAQYAVVRATITDTAGRTMAQATKREDAKGFPDYLEKAETGAVGRALAMCGMGTQFCADDLDEGERIVDSPRRGGDAYRQPQPQGQRQPPQQQRPQQQRPQQQPASSIAGATASGEPQTYTCAGCDADLRPSQALYSERKFGQTLCPRCQHQTAAAGAA